MLLRYFLFVLMLFFPHIGYAGVIINEIAWMGALPKIGETVQVAANNEWIELYNSSEEAISLEGWKIMAEDGTPDISLSGSILGNGFFLLERSDDDSAQGVIADFIYTGALSNSGEKLELLDAGGTIVDSVDADDGWAAGDNATKETMQRSESGGWITAQGTPRASNAGALSLSPLSLSPPQDEEENKQTNENSQFTSLVIFPEIYADAGKDMVTAVGSQIQFVGTALGTKKEPLAGARFLWNFGDGETKEGKSAAHIYRVPGLYRVGLHIASGGFTASDYSAVDVRPNKVEITNVVFGDDGYVLFRNPSAFDIDIGGWAIEDASKRVFLVPSYTQLRRGSEAAFSNETTGLLQNAARLPLLVRYPNGKQAFEYSMNNETVSLHEHLPSVELKTKEASSRENVGISSGKNLNNILRLRQIPDKADQEKNAAKNEAVELFVSLNEDAEKKDGIHESAFATTLVPSRLFFIGAFAISIISAIGFLVLRSFYF